jgi:hypothetical protein
VKVKSRGFETFVRCANKKCIVHFVSEITSVTTAAVSGPFIRTDVSRRLSRHHNHALHFVHVKVFVSNKQNQTSCTFACKGRWLV